MNENASGTNYSCLTSLKLWERSHCPSKHSCYFLIKSHIAFKATRHDHINILNTTTNNNLKCEIFRSRPGSREWTVNLLCAPAAQSGSRTSSTSVPSRGSGTALVSRWPFQNFFKTKSKPENQDVNELAKYEMFWETMNESVCGWVSSWQRALLEMPEGTPYILFFKSQIHCTVHTTIGLKT